MKVLSVVGARPNFIKVAPLITEFKKRGIENLLIHTGQHFDEQLSQTFFDELGIASPDLHLGIGSGNHAVQTAETMIRFDEVLHDIDPDFVLIVGEVNSAFACALTAAKLLYPVVHVGAGVRNFDRTNPEEINRVMTDQLASLLFTATKGATEQLKLEGITENRIFTAGSAVLDTVVLNRERALNSDIIQKIGVEKGEFILATLHKSENVDNQSRLKVLVQTLTQIAQKIPVVFPMHPRTIKTTTEYDLIPILRDAPGIYLLEPLGYLSFLSLVLNCKGVITDSGVLQEETTFLGIPCLTTSTSNDRPATVDQGTNTIVGIDDDLILNEIDKILAGNGKTGCIPDFWDGKAATRIVDTLIKYFS